MSPRPVTALPVRRPAGTPNRAPSTAPLPVAEAPRTGADAVRQPRLRRYEVLVRTELSPAVVASLPVRSTPTVVPRQALYRVRVAIDQDIAEVVGRLAAAGAGVTDLRVVPFPG